MERQATDQAIRLYLADAFTQDDFREALKVIADGVRELAGFDVAAVSVLRDTDEFEFVAVSGNNEAARALMGEFNPRRSVQSELDRGERWGRFVFVPPEISERPRTWVPSISYPDVENAWDPDNLLTAPLFDPAGNLIGLLSVDVPQDGRAPGPDRRRVLDLYAEQADRVVCRALEQERLSERVRMATAARRIMRNSSARLGPEELLAQCEPMLLEAFRAHGLWIQVFADHQRESSSSVVAGLDVVVPDRLQQVTEQAAHRCWAQQRAAIVSPRRHTTDLISDDEQRQILAFLSTIGRTSLLFTPLGAGQQCLGSLVMTRRAEDDEWTDTEREAALDIARDLGGAILNARLYQRDQELVDHLRSLDDYRSHLIARMAHELNNPLTAVLGNTELLEDEHDLPDDARSWVAGVRRGADRLRGLVDELLVLSRVSAPLPATQTESADLRKAAVAAVEMCETTARSHDIRLRAELPGDAIVVSCSTADLDVVCANLVGNAVKYTDGGGLVDVSVQLHEREATLVVADTGIGIGPEDRARIFEEFYRSSDQRARARSGTGLGLALVAHVMNRSGGQISLESTPGQGSVFAAAFPLAGGRHAKPEG